ncbi:MAG: hypothetical protein WCG48_01450 [Candidatus Berkelbacteria bacterium]
MGKSKAISAAAWTMIVFAGFSLLIIIVGQLLPDQPPTWMKGIVGDVPDDTSNLPVAPMAVLAITAVLNVIEIFIASRLLKKPQTMWLIAIIFILIQPALRYFLGLWISGYSQDTISTILVSMLVPVILTIMILSGRQKK